MKLFNKLSLSILILSLTAHYELKAEEPAVSEEAAPTGETSPTEGNVENPSDNKGNKEQHSKSLYKKLEKRAPLDAIICEFKKRDLSEILGNDELSKIRSYSKLLGNSRLENLRREYYGYGPLELDIESNKALYSADTARLITKMRIDLRRGKKGLNDKDANFTRLYQQSGTGKPEEAFRRLRAITNQDAPFYHHLGAAKLDAYDDVLGKAYYSMLTKMAGNTATTEDQMKAYKALKKAYANFESSLNTYTGAAAPRNSKEPAGTFELTDEHKSEILKWYSSKLSGLRKVLSSCFDRNKIPLDP